MDMAKIQHIKQGSVQARRFEEQFKEGYRLPRYWTVDGYPIVGGVIMKGEGYNSVWVPESKDTEDRGWEDREGWYTGGRITDPGNFKRTFELSDTQLMGYMVTSFLDTRKQFPMVDDWFCMSCGYRAARVIRKLADPLLKEGLTRVEGSGKHQKDVLSSDRCEPKTRCDL